MPSGHLGAGRETGVGMVGRTAIVTGGSSGIGKETARGLARLGATVILAVRDPRKGEAVRQEIIRDTGNPNVEVMQVDLAVQASVRAFAAAFKATHPRLHVLVNDAGFYTNRLRLTADGLESTFAVSHIGHFLLTNLLLDVLKASAPARIINVTSSTHRGGRMDFGALRGEGRFSGMRAYTQSKLANVLFAYELARQLEGTGITANSADPAPFGRTSERAAASSSGW